MPSTNRDRGGSLREIHVEKYEDGFLSEHWTAELELNLNYFFLP